MYKKLLELIEENKFKEVQDNFKSMHVQDIASLLNHIDVKLNLIKVFKLLPKDIGAEVFSYADSDVQEKLVSAMSDKELEFILEEMFIDDAVDFVEEMPANIVERVLKFSTPETRTQINKFLKYEDHTAGSIMTTEFIDIKENMSASTALKRIRKVAREKETINVLYVTTSERVLKGDLTIRDLIVADEEEKIENIMNTNVIFAETSTDQEEIARLFKQYGFLALPIVDKEQRLVGIVTVDDVLDVIEEETSEDISKMHGVTPIEKPYMKTSIFKLWLNRVPWLMLLMISATFTGMVISRNEALLSSGIYGILLTSCIPMLMDTGGNAGGQSSATIIRGIAVGEISFKDFLKVLWKEIRVGVFVGLALSVVCFGKIMLIDGLILNVPGVSALSAFVIALSMFFAIVLAKIVGCSLPLIAKKLKLDPAVMASPFITTIVDILSLLVYCFLATSILI